MISTSHFHPMLVHFPIALVTLGYIAELEFSFSKKRAVPVKDQLVSSGVRHPVRGCILSYRATVYS